MLLVCDDPYPYGSTQSSASPEVQQLQPPTQQRQRWDSSYPLPYSPSFLTLYIMRFSQVQLYTHMCHTCREKRIDYTGVAG
nr:MAG TPA: hypothetical protein [Herelleviridae sp.]